MPKREYQPVHAEADKFEPRLARALDRAAERMRETMSINALAIAIAGKDVRAAMAQLPAAAVEDALRPVATITRDAVLRGGRVAADHVRTATEAR